LITPNAFYHVALTYDKVSGLETIYLNGTLTAQQNIGQITPQTSYNLYLGRRPPTQGATYQFSGVLDEPSLYNRALTPSEIQAVYTAGSAGKCPPTCDPHPSGLVSWWPGQGNALDIVGPNKGLLDGGLGFANGEVELGFAYTTSGEDVRIPASASLNVGTGTGFTVEAWINCSTVSHLNPIFEWNKGDGVTVEGPQLYVWSNGALYGNVVGTTGYVTENAFFSNPGLVTANTFYHVALTYSQATGLESMYLNGALVAQENIGQITPQTSYNLYLGRRPPTNGETYQFSGVLDEPSLYNRALTLAEIQTIYQAGTAGKCQ
jgi:hypothetical protein